MQPSWQVDECPRWCAVDHADSDHPDDRVHRSMAAPVPVIFRESILSAAGVLHPVGAAEAEIGISRADGDPQVWIYVGVGRGAEIELSLESARRLSRELDERLPHGE